MGFRIALKARALYPKESMSMAFQFREYTRIDGSP